MSEVNGDRIETLVLAVLNQRSSATAKHVKKVISAIFSHARRIGVFTGTNPATLTRPIAVKPVREARALSLEETKRLLEALPTGRTRAREITTLCVSTSMNISEVRGMT
jgi:integrase